MAQTSWRTHCCVLAPRGGIPSPISPESFSPSARSQPALLDSCTHARHRGSPLCEHRACTAVARLHPACEEGRVEFLAGVAEKCSWCVYWDGAWKRAALIYSASWSWVSSYCWWWLGLLEGMREALHISGGPLLSIGEHLPNDHLARSFPPSEHISWCHWWSVVTLKKGNLTMDVVDQERQFQNRDRQFHFFLLWKTVSHWWQTPLIFIRPESDHWQCLSLTDSLTD